MKRLFWAVHLLLYLLLLPGSLRAAELLTHNLTVSFYPQERRFTAEDVVTVPEEFLPDLQFLLHSGLKPSSPTPGVRIVRKTGGSRNVPFESFQISLPPGQDSFVLTYGGSIFHQLESYGKEQARGFKQTPGVISPEGVFLTGSSLWYPSFDAGLLTFDLTVELPATWDAVSQGERTLHLRQEDRTSVRWESPEPQEEIVVVAAPFTEYLQPAGKVDAMVFLRTPDEELANKYLDATVRYLSMYEHLIGAYPYKKFALVENFWETGYGMPSFTLLGPKIIRFPFILYTSYPHEILHNWWGNGVFPNYVEGNWSEGLTAYLSDHLMKEMRGEAVAYRQETLQKYADYVLSDRDFPLSQFLSRHSSSSETVGYGKSLMLFHMLRQDLGDKNFVGGLQDFYRKNRFRLASFSDLRGSFERVAAKEMKVDFQQWVTRPGAPELKVSRAEVRTQGDGYRLTALLQQVQSGEGYRLSIPLAVTMEGRGQSYQTTVFMRKKQLELNLHLDARPLRLDVDPEFDLFRRLTREESPPALTRAFGAKKMLIILPASANRGLLDAYRQLAKSLSRSGPDQVEVSLDVEIKQLPTDRAVTLLGWENHFLNDMAAALSPYDVSINRDGVSIGRTEIPRSDHAVVLTANSPKNKESSLTWVASDLPEALPGLGRKLPHYHKYSYLGFQGKEPDNVAKGRWPVLNSPMTVFLPLEDGTFARVARAKLAPRKPLTSLPPVFSKERMMETVRFLASDELQGRGFGTKGLDRAAEFVAKKFQQAGLRPAGDTSESYFQTWEGRGGVPERKVKMRNVVGVIPAKYPALKAQSVVVAAHYDHLGLGWPEVRREDSGKIHPGADDNASGVAVLLELARILGKELRPDRSVVFVAFAGEEAGKIGSKYYVSKEKRFPAVQCIGMLNLDTVGRLAKKKLLVLGAGSAREWTHIFRGAGYVAGVEVEMVSQELDSSDQKSFQEAGVPAVQLFSGPHLDYHRPSDTAERIDPEGLVKVASVAKEVIEYLAGRQVHLTSSRKPGSKIESTPRGKRRVNLGIVPDFAYSGDGCRLSGVVPGSPAESSGLREGDVIIGIGSDGVHSLKDLSDILKSLNPGDRVSITYLRAGKEMSSEAELVER